MELFKCYVKDRLLDGSQFIYASRLSARNFRREINGMGAATIQLDVEDFNPDDDDETETINYNDIQGKWLFIRNTIVNDNTPVSVTENNFEWWGYIDRVQFEYDKQLDRYRGTVEALEFGHYVTEYPLQYGETSKINDSSFIENGFNPSIDGYYVGNKEAASSEDDAYDNYYRRKDYSYESDNINYWTIQEIAEYIINEYINTCPIPLQLDLSRIEYQDEIDGVKFPRYDSILFNVEPRPSYSGSNIGQILDDLLSPFGWFYGFNNDENDLKVVINLTDRSGLENKNFNSELNITDAATAFLQITGESKVYDRVHIKGNRVLVSGTMTTYAPSAEHWGIAPNFTTESIQNYVRPYPSEYYPNYDELVEDVNVINSIDGHTTSLPDDVLDTSLDDNARRDLVFNELQSKRKTDKETYQSFKFKLGDINGSDNVGSDLWTCVYPGKFEYGDIIPFFPRLEFQSSPKEVIDSVTGNYSLAGSVLDVPKITNIPSTPPLCEMKYEDFIPFTLPVESTGRILDAVEKLKPVMFYQSYGSAIEYSGVIIYAPQWIEGTSGEHESVQGYKMDLIWDGIRINSAYPEVLSWGNDCIFREVRMVDVTPDVSAPEDFGLQSNGFRKEWQNFSSQASKRDPYRAPYMGKGHWGKMVFSFSAYSNQQIEVWKGTTLTDNVKYIEDPSLNVWVLRRGLVARLRSDDLISGTKPPYIVNALEHLPDDIIVRNDLPKAKVKLNKYWNYYSKKKRAVRLESRIVDENGSFEKIAYGDPDENGDMRFIQVGDFVKNIKEGEKKIISNSSVSSIEYMIDGGSPRVIISTEYPSSPVATRQAVPDKINAYMNTHHDEGESWLKIRTWAQENK